jgi:hypothetical protein
MSRIHEKRSVTRADRPARRPRRSTALSLTSLEDRRLMTAGVATTAPDPTAAPPTPTVATTLMATEPVSLAIAGDSGPTDAWIYMGSEAQFGPTGSYVLYGGGNAWPTTPPGTSPDAPPEQAKLDAAFAKQSTDVQAIQDKSEVTPKLLASLRTARAAVAAQAGQPDATLLKTFQDDAQNVQESGGFTDAQQKQLKDEYTAVLKSAGVSDDAVAALFAAQDAVKAASHVTPDDVALLSADQKAVQTLMDAMPHDAVTFAAADGFKGNAGGAPMVLHGGTAMNSGMGVTTTAVPLSAAGTMLAGAAVDPNTDPATLAAASAPITTTASGPVTTISAPVTTTATPVTTTAAPIKTISAPITTTAAPVKTISAPAPTLYTRAVATAMGRAHAGGLQPGSFGGVYSQWNTGTAPVTHGESSNVAPLNSGVKRPSARSMYNIRRGAVAATGSPAARQRLAFIGTMRKAPTS